jgi:hypothetical protein
MRLLAAGISMWGVLLWIVVAILVGFAGLNKKGGFWRALLIGMIFSPIVSLILVLGSANRNPRGCRHCGNDENEVEYCGICNKNEDGMDKERS